MNNQESDRAHLVFCPLCTLEYSEEYFPTHIKVDHNKDEKDHLLACILLDDHREWLEEAMMQAIGKP